MPPQSVEARRLIPELFRRVAITLPSAFAPDSLQALATVVPVGLGEAQIASKQAVKSRLGLRAGTPGGRPAKTHTHELAVAFGFLEEIGNNYIAGRYGLVAQLIDHPDWPANYFDRERAKRALWLYALIERHGDMTLPVLGLASDDQLADGPFVSVIKRHLVLKAQRWATGDLPRSAAHHAGAAALAKYGSDWGVKSHKDRQGAPPESR